MKAPIGKLLSHLINYFTIIQGYWPSFILFQTLSLGSLLISLLLGLEFCASIRMLLLVSYWFTPCVFWSLQMHSRFHLLSAVAVMTGHQSPFSSASSTPRLYSYSPFRFLSSFLSYPATGSFFCLRSWHSLTDQALRAQETAPQTALAVHPGWTCANMHDAAFLSSPAMPKTFYLVQEPSIPDLGSLWASSCYPWHQSQYNSRSAP